jgi:hypothetical protein
MFMTKITSQLLTKIQLRTDQLYPLIILAGFSFLVFLIPLPPNDFWWHLKIGEIIYTQGSIPTTNMFAWSLDPQTPFTYGAWLGELTLFVIYKLGKLELLSFIRSTLILLVCWFVGYETYLRSHSWRLASLSIAFLGTMTLNNLAVRPQIFTWMIFVAFIFVLNRFAEGTAKPATLFSLPFLMLAWVNMHGTFILGGVLIGIFFTGELLRRLLDTDNTVGWQKIKWLFLVGCATGLAMLANPNGPGIVRYVADLMTDQPSQSLIMEWQSPTPTGLQNTAFFLSILLLLAAAMYTRALFTPTEMLLTASFIWLAWTGQRYIIWYGITVLPILGKLISGLPLRMPSLTPSKNFLNVIIVLVMFIPTLAVLPWYVNRFPFPSAYWEIVQRNSPVGPLVSTTTPVSAAEYLKTHPGDRLFNEMGYGSYLIWAIPDQSVFIDPRVELYPFEQWDDYRRISDGVRYNELLSKYGANQIILDKQLQSQLAGLLPGDNSWRLEYEDAFAQIWLRNP